MVDSIKNSEGYEKYRSFRIISKQTIDELNFANRFCLLERNKNKKVEGFFGPNKDLKEDIIEFLYNSHVTEKLGLSFDKIFYNEDLNSYLKIKRKEDEYCEKLRKAKNSNDNEEPEIDMKKIMKEFKKYDR